MKNLVAFIGIGSAFVGLFPVTIFCLVWYFLIRRRERIEKDAEYRRMARIQREENAVSITL